MLFREDARAHLGVLLDVLELVGSELAGLEEHRVGDPDLADVVEERGLADERDVVFGKPECRRDLSGGLTDASGVLLGLVVVVVGGEREPLDRLLPRLLELPGSLRDGPLQPLLVALLALLEQLAVGDVAADHDQLTPARVGP